MHLIPLDTTGNSFGHGPIQTDGWRAYGGLIALGYQHQIVRPLPDLGSNLLPRANRIASLLKRWLLGTHQGAVRYDHLDYYLDEYTFRFNRRTSTSRGLLFYRLIEQAIATAPVHHANLVGGRTNRSQDDDHNILGSGESSA